MQPSPTGRRVCHRLHAPRRRPCWTAPSCSHRLRQQQQLRHPRAPRSTCPLRTMQHQTMLWNSSHAHSHLAQQGTNAPQPQLRNLPPNLSLQLLPLLPFRHQASERLRMLSPAASRSVRLPPWPPLPADSRRVCRPRSTPPHGEQSLSLCRHQQRCERSAENVEIQGTHAGIGAGRLGGQAVTCFAYGHSTPHPSSVQDAATRSSGSCLRSRAHATRASDGGWKSVERKSQVIACSHADPSPGCTLSHSIPPLSDPRRALLPSSVARLSFIRFASTHAP